MLQGRFGNTTGAPYLECRISFPRLGIRGLVSFLVDTGADASVLMPADTKKLGIDFRSLRNPTTSQGIGGLAQGFNETVVMSFSDRRYIYSYLLQIEIAASHLHSPYRFFPLPPSDRTKLMRRSCAFRGDLLNKRRGPGCRR